METDRRYQCNEEITVAKALRNIKKPVIVIDIRRDRKNVTQ